MMKSTATIALLFFCSALLLSQENDYLFFLETDTTWRKEMFVFPINFAPDIEYQGREDARFPEGWEKQDSPNFWSYVFAWNLENSGDITATDLEANLQKYFNGLMRSEATVVQISKKEEADNHASFKGVVKTIDAFFTDEPLNLNVLVEKIYCEEKNKSIVLFRFSPQEFGADVWRKLAEVKLPEVIAACGETKVKMIYDLMSVEHLQLLAGEYAAIDQNRAWKITIEELDGELFGNDGGYRYKLNPIGGDKFINPDDGATVVFDSTDEDAITFVIFGRVKFKKVK